MHTLVFNKIKKDNLMEIQNKVSAEIYCMEMDYQSTGTLNEAFLTWKDAFTGKFKSSKEIVKLQSTLRTRFCKSIITEAKENYYITDNDLVQFTEYFNVGVVIIKDYKNLKKQFKERKYFIYDCNFNVTKNKHVFKYYKYLMIIGYFDNIHFNLFYNQEKN